MKNRPFISKAASKFLYLFARGFDENTAFGPAALRLRAAASPRGTGRARRTRRPSFLRKGQAADQPFFRGELADKILAAGMAGRFVDLAGLETNADAKSALLEWIKKTGQGRGGLPEHERGRRAAA